MNGNPTGGQNTVNQPTAAPGLVTRRSPPSDQGGWRLVRRSSKSDLPRVASHFCYSETLSSLEIKNISLYQKAKSVVHSGHPALVRRASAVVTDVGRGAMDAGLRWTMAWTGVRQNRVVLAPVAGVKLSDSQKLTGGDGVTKNSSPGRARYKP